MQAFNTDVSVRTLDEGRSDGAPGSGGPLGVDVEDEPEGGVFVVEEEPLLEGRRERVGHNGKAHGVCWGGGECDGMSRSVRTWQGGWASCRPGG